ncbi:MAG: hypothetical protein QNJ20_12300 [Paracoccaceae bacterium]|nr:hypothetical protein [Paracoccaceae bacterium]
MTVLKEYQRLEAEAIWRATPDAQRRDVVVSIGKATITIAAPNGTALTHWSLPAMIRLNPGETPALFGPGDDVETLEIAEPEMIAAIDRVLAAIQRRSTTTPWAWRLGRWGLLAAGLAAAIYWLPGAITAYTASLVPESARVQIGADLLAETQRVAGQPCQSPGGDRALEALAARLFPDGGTRLIVLPSTLEGTAHLPDGSLLVSHKLVEDFETPEVLAGFALAEKLRASTSDPMARLLEASPFRAALALLSTGHLRKIDKQRMAEWLVVRPPDPVADAPLLAEMHARRVDSEPYGRALDISGEATAALISGGPYDPEPVLGDTDWIALQSICSE